MDWVYGLLNFYQGWKNHCNNAISDAFIQHAQWNKDLSYPYCVSAGEELLQKFKAGNHVGIICKLPLVFMDLRIYSSFECE